jgi:hypothetical protein
LSACDCLVDECVEAPGRDILFNSPIPDGRVELCEPGTKRVELLRRQFLHRLFDFFDRGHGFSLSAGARGQNHG